MTSAVPHPSVGGPWPAPRLRALQVEELFRFSGVSAAYSYFGALLTLGVLFEVSTDHTPAAAWFVAATLLAVLRGILVVAYRRRPPESDPSRYARLAIVANLFAGVLWGILGTVLFPAGPVYAQLFVVMVIICFVAGSVTAYSAVEGAHEALSIPATIPTAAFLFFMRDGMHWYAGVAALFFCFAIVYYARQLHTHLEAGFLAQRIVLLRDGQILQLGSLASLYEAPADPFVTRFVRAQTYALPWSPP